MLGAADINQQIIEVYAQLKSEDFLKRTHFHAGRYENLYLDRARIPAIISVLAQAERLASEVLNNPALKIHSGFWVNEMGQGAVTSEHDHDEYDELLSAVYYVQVPQNSGDLIIVDKHSRTIVSPEAGMFVFFAPQVRHSVSKNVSVDKRISIGINFGPV